MGFRSFLILKIGVLLSIFIVVCSKSIVEPILSLSCLAPLGSATYLTRVRVSYDLPAFEVVGTLAL